MGRQKERKLMETKPITKQDDAEIRLRFVAIENRVHDNLRRLVCRARSGNMAKRIARALNIVKPNERGQ